uniref:Uncharacterized protein n=1 Tax=Avena sativa TaxID=4498 RepID=A0ACD5YYJ5_AVESA
MNRRFVNLLVDRLRAPRPAFKLHRIDPASLFYPTGSPKPADPAEEIRESAPFPSRGRLSSAAMSFDWPCKRYQTGWMDFMAFKNKIIAVDNEGRTVLYDSASRAVFTTTAMRPALQSNNMFVTVGDSLYVMSSEAGLPSRRLVWFYALIYGEPPGIFGPEDWYWRSLNLPPFDYADADHRSSDPDDDGSGSDYYSTLDADYSSDDDPADDTSGGDESSPHPCAISAFTVVGGSRIWVSTVAAGTYSYDTASREWSKVGAWALPFRGRAAYVPEHSLWFGFSDQDGRLCAADLALTPPLQHELVSHPPPDEAGPLTPTTHLLPLGSGKLCIARLSHETEEDETFAVLTGVEVQRRAGIGNLQMIEHKSRRYGFGDADVRLL